MPQTKSKEQTQLDNTFRFADPHSIEEAAYYKWLNRGRNGGDSMEDWLEAELELQSNLYSEDDDVERSLASSVPKQKMSAVNLKSKRRDSIVANESEKVVDTKRSDNISTINQLTMASQQDET